MSPVSTTLLFFAFTGYRRMIEVFYVMISAFALMNVFVAVITDAVITEKGKQDQDVLHGRVLGHEELLKELFQTCTALNQEKEIDHFAFRAFLRKASGSARARLQ